MSDGTQVDFGLQNYLTLLFDGEKSKNALRLVQEHFCQGEPNTSSEQISTLLTR